MVCRCVVFVLINLLIIHHVSAEQLIDPLCGPRSLYLICERFGVQASIDEICTISQYNKNSGTSMLNLLNAAKKKGFDVIPAKLTYEELSEQTNPNIVYVSNNHFTVVLDCNDKGVLIQDYPEKPNTVEKSMFCKIWNGETLLITGFQKKNEENDSQVAGANIAFNSTYHYESMIYEGDIITNDFILKNTGSENLDILYSRPDCGCTKAKLSKNTYSPGDHGVLTVTVDTEGKGVGYHEEKVAVRSNSTLNPLINVMMGFEIIKPEIAVTPDKLSLDGLHQGETVRKEVTLTTENPNVILTNLVAPEYISTDIDSTMFENTKEYSITFEITLNENGFINNTIQLSTNSNGKSIINIPISGYVTSHFEIEPSRIFDNLMINTEEEYEITLTSDDNLQIGSFENSSPFIKVYNSSNSDSNKLSIEVITPQEECIIYDTIRITNENNIFISEIPVIINVNED